MTWPVFLVISAVPMILAGLAGGWLLPMAGLTDSWVRYVCFGLAGGIIGLLYVRMKGTPRA